MTPKEQEVAIGELEDRVDRLRVLYEQYFLGFEKLEPTVPRKDVDRRFALLRKEQIRNTALRFRFNVVTQKFNTYSMYWVRICRQIEDGTYKRHVRRAQQRFGDSASVSPDVSIDVDLADFDLEDMDGLDVENVLAEAEAAAEAPAMAAKAPARNAVFDTEPPTAFATFQPPPRVQPHIRPAPARPGANGGARVPVPAMADAAAGDERPRHPPSDRTPVSLPAANLLREAAHERRALTPPLGPVGPGAAKPRVVVRRIAPTEPRFDARTADDAREPTSPAVPNRAPVVPQPHQAGPAVGYGPPAARVPPPATRTAGAPGPSNPLAGQPQVARPAAASPLGPAPVRPAPAPAGAVPQRMPAPVDGRPPQAPANPGAPSPARVAVPGPRPAPVSPRPVPQRPVPASAPAVTPEGARPAAPPTGAAPLPGSPMIRPRMPLPLPSQTKKE